jgi:hypothetical protein
METDADILGSCLCVLKCTYSPRYAAQHQDPEGRGGSDDSRLAPVPTGRCFPSPRYPGQPIKRAALTQAWCRTANKAGVSSNVDLYCARHTFDTDRFKATKDPVPHEGLDGAYRSVNHRPLPAPGAASCRRLDGRSQPDPARVYVIIYVIGD